MKAHFIAIGGSAMHNLAIALHLKGYEVSGSDDEIFEPSKSRLKKYDLLPPNIGWNPSKIDHTIDEVILGMHARIDNPELLKAQELGLKIYSYPEYIYEQTKDKIRVVIGGSHGKTSITSMILHALSSNAIPHDYMVGAQLDGFDCMVGLSQSSKIAVLEGDEYLSSPIDRRPKFHLYHPNVALISGIAWDHINVFPTFENYVEQFETFANLIEPGGKLIYFEGDKEVEKIALNNNQKSIHKIPYHTPLFSINNGITTISIDNTNYELKVFGQHNLQNMLGAQLVCEHIGLSKEAFYQSMTSFNGASKRLELVAKNNQTLVYKDFAHSPSKLKATTSALKHQYPQRKLVACMELHTFSSLTKEFLQQYKGAMNTADVAIVYYSNHTLEHKKLAQLSPHEVKDAFGSDDIIIFTKSNEMVTFLEHQNWLNTNLLLMSSGNFDGIDFGNLASKIIHHHTQ